MAKKTFKGIVVSTKMQKTVVVAVDASRPHPVYGKTVKNTKRFKVHDEVGVQEGDVVVIEASRPFSKEVSWVIVEKL